MAGPDIFGNSPRVFVNDAANGGKTLTSTPRVVLGAGIVASIEPANAQPGEVITMHLDAPAGGEVADLQNQVTGIDDRLTAVEELDEVVTLPWATTITPNYADITSRIIKITAQAGTFTLANPTNAVEGLGYRVIILSGGGGDNAWGANWVIAGPWVGLGATTLPVLSTDPDECIICDFVYLSGKMRLMTFVTGSTA